MYTFHIHLSDIYISNHLCTSVSLRVHISLNLTDICISNPLYISVSLHVHISLASLLMSTSQTRSTSMSQTVSISGSLSPCTYLTYISLTSTFQTRSTSASQTVCTSQSLYMYISHLHLSDIYIWNCLCIYVCLTACCPFSLSSYPDVFLSSVCALLLQPRVKPLTPVSADEASLLTVKNLPCLRALSRMLGRFVLNEDDTASSGSRGFRDSLV